MKLKKGTNLEEMKFTGCYSTACSLYIMQYEIVVLIVVREAPLPNCSDPCEYTKC